MRHFFKASTYQTAPSHRTNPASATPWFRQVPLATAFICFGLATEGLACHNVTLKPTSLTYYAEYGKANPANQTITVSRNSSSTATLTASDNATWLAESPTSTSITTSKTVAASVNISGLSAGTRNATTTIKVGTWCSYTVPVTLIISPSTTSTTTTTKSATLAWNAVTSTTVSGYDVYVGTAPSLYTTKTNVGNVTTYTVNSLTVGKTYYFAVTAYNSAGESIKSNEASKTIQ